MRENGRVLGVQQWVLTSAIDKICAYSKPVELSVEEAPKCIFGRAHNWLPAYVETGIDQHWATCRIAECADQSIEARIRVLMDGLHAG